MHAQATDGGTTLVWIGDDEAIIVRWADRAEVERVRYGPPAGDQPDRRDDLCRFVDRVACHVPDERDVVVVGPGGLRRRLERVIRADDRHHGRHRLVHAASAERLSEQALVARVRAVAGDAPLGRVATG